MKIEVLLVGVTLVAACSAHLCLLNPHQRGSEGDINSAGESNCLLVTSGPCGGRPKEMPNGILRRGQNNSVTFQKNLSHWNAANPGRFDVKLMDSAGNTAMLLTVADSNLPSLTVYEVKAMVADSVAAGAGVLQVQYVTMNPNAPAVFFQCADVMVM